MALAKYVREKYGVETTIHVNPVTHTVGTDVVTIAKNNPDRLALIIVNLSANTLYVAWDRDVSSTHGILLDANGGYLILLAEQDLELTGYEMFAVASGANSSIFVLEVEAV